MPFAPVLFDLRQVLRGMRLRPGHAAAARVTLTVVLAASATRFSAISATMLRPVPFRHGEKTVALLTWPPGPREWKNGNPLHALDLVRFRERARVLRDISSFDLQAVRSPAVPIRRLSARWWPTPASFRLVKDEPIIGRAFTD